MPHSSKELNMLKASIIAEPDRSPYFIGKDYAALETEGDIQSAALKLIETLPDIEQTTARKEIDSCTSSFVLTKLVGQLFRDKAITEHQEKQEKINREKEQAKEAAKKAEQEAAARNTKIALEIEQQNIAAEQIRETKETEAIVGFILYLLASIIVARVLAAAISQKIKGLIQTAKQTKGKMKHILRPFPLIISALLVLAICPLPYGYYQFLRIAVTIWGLTGIIQAAAKPTPGAAKTSALIIGSGIAILYNPILPILLDKEIWVYLNLISIPLILLTTYLIHKHP